MAGTRMAGLRPVVSDEQPAILRTLVVQTTGTILLDLPGISPSGAARLLVEVGDITRFPVSVAHRARQVHQHT